MAKKINLPKPLFSEKGKRAVLLLHAYSGSSNDVRMLSRRLEKKIILSIRLIFQDMAR